MDGSLTAADLAPGTIPTVPAAKPSRSILTSGLATTPTAAAGSFLWAPAGPYATGETVLAGIVSALVVTLP